MCMYMYARTPCMCCVLCVCVCVSLSLSVCVYTFKAITLQWPCHHSLKDYELDNASYFLHIFCWCVWMPRYFDDVVCTARRTTSLILPPRMEGLSTSASSTVPQTLESRTFSLRRRIQMCLTALTTRMLGVRECMHNTPHSGAPSFRFLLLLCFSTWK